MATTCWYWLIDLRDCSFIFDFERDQKFPLQHSSLFWAPLADQNKKTLVNTPLKLITNLMKHVKRKSLVDLHITYCNGLEKISNSHDYLEKTLKCIYKRFNELVQLNIWMRNKCSNASTTFLMAWQKESIVILSLNILAATLMRKLVSLKFIEFKSST